MKRKVHGFTPLPNAPFVRMRVLEKRKAQFKNTPTQGSWITGFTMIELLIVITVMSLIMGVAIAAYIGTQKNSRDNRRKVDLEKIRQALEVYRSETGQYPLEVGSDTSRGTLIPCNGQMWGVAGCNGDEWDPSIGVALDLNTSEVMSVMPVDPINDAGHYYYYEPACNQFQIASEHCDVPQDCVNKGCCGYTIGAKLEIPNTWIQVCNP